MCETPPTKQRSDYRRVCRTWKLNGETTIGIHKVYYDSSDTPVACTQDEVILRDADSTSLETRCALIQRAFELPLLFYDELEHVTTAHTCEDSLYVNSKTVLTGKVENEIIVHFIALGWTPPNSDKLISLGDRLRLVRGITHEELPYDE